MACFIVNRDGVIVDSNTNLLKEVVEVARDGARFYEQAERDLDDIALRSVFMRMAEAKHDLIDALSARLRRDGESPPRSGTLAGALRKTYTEIRAALVDDDAEVWVARLEEAEDRLLECVRTALERCDDVALSGSLQAYLPRISECHEVMRRLKDRLATA